MKLEVTCPYCGQKFEGDVLQSIHGEKFVVCKREINIIRGDPLIHYFCNTYIPIIEETTKQKNA